MTPRLLLLYRKTSAFFSIETVFGQIAAAMAGSDHYRLEQVRVPAEGLSWKSLRANLGFTRKLRADVFHITGDVHYLALFLPGRRTVLTIHDCVFMYQTSGLKRWVLQRWLLKWPIARCRWITTISPATKDDIIRFSGCPPEKIVVIPNPANEKIAVLPKPFDREKPVLLFIGTTPNKNLKRTLHALEGIPCVLDIVGRIPEQDRQLLDGSGVSYVNAFGLSEQEMIGKYAAADIVLFPSTFEGFGMPVIEGQKAGRPVITSDISPLKEVAGGAACLVDPQEVASIRQGILKVIEDKTYRESLVEKGLMNSERFRPEVISNQYLGLYNEIINSQGCAV